MKLDFFETIKIYLLTLFGTIFFLSMPELPQIWIQKQISKFHKHFYFSLISIPKIWKVRSPWLERLNKVKILRLSRILTSIDITTHPRQSFVQVRHKRGLHLQQQNKRRKIITKWRKMKTSWGLSRQERWQLPHPNNNKELLLLFRKGVVLKGRCPDSKKKEGTHRCSSNI